MTTGTLDRTGTTSTTTSITTVVRAAVYVRISSDPEGQRAGVERQRTECEELAARHGWDVVAVYEDNDVSAYSGRPRPAFDRLLADVEAGAVDVVVAWASDRLYRRMTDLVTITARLAPRARIVTVVGGDVDLTSAEGILRAQVMGSVAEFESRRKAERVSARARQRAEVEGRTTTAMPPFGYRWADPDPEDPRRPRSRSGLVVDPVQAAALGTAFRMVAQDGKVTRAARWLREQGYVGATGRPITAGTLRRILTCPRYAGMVTYKGEIVGTAPEESRIIDPDLFEQVQVILADPTRRTSPGRPAGTLLSAIAVCARCGSAMNASNKHSRSGAGRTRVPVYVCHRHQHLTRRRDLVDEPVVELVAAYLTSQRSRLRRQVAPGASRAATKAAEQAAALRDRLDTLAGLVAAGDLDPVDYAAAAKQVRARLAEAERKAVIVSGMPATGALLAGDDPAAEWRRVAADDVPAARAILKELVAGVVVLPAAVPGHPAVSDLRVVWRMP